MRIRACLALALCSVSVGCAEQDHFFPPRAFALRSDMAPVAEGEQVSYWQVQVGHELPLRRPTVEEQRRAEATYDAPPEPWLRRAPWIELSDFGIEIEYSITSQAEDELALELLVDPWTEFHEYVPGIVMTEDEATPNLSGYDHYVLVPAGSRVIGTVRMDEMEETAYDFATILENQDTTNANCVVYFPNDHEDEGRCANAIVPETVPGLVGFTIGMRTTEAADVAIEFLVRVRDHENKLWIEDSGDLRWQLPPREQFTPLPPAEDM